MFRFQDFVGEPVQTMVVPGRIGVGNGYFFLGCRLKGTNAPLFSLFLFIACNSFRGEFAEGAEQALYFVQGVVVDQADAEEAALGFDAEAFGEI